MVMRYAITMHRAPYMYNWRGVGRLSTGDIKRRKHHRKIAIVIHHYSLEGTKRFVQFEYKGFGRR